jgi:hypothetical protein
MPFCGSRTSLGPNDSPISLSACLGGAARPLCAPGDPLLRDVLTSMSYYWGTTQAEYATDLVFKSRPHLAEFFLRCGIAPGAAASESGRLCHGDGAQGRGDRLRRSFMLTIREERVPGGALPRRLYVAYAQRKSKPYWRGSVPVIHCRTFSLWRGVRTGFAPGCFRAARTASPPRRAVSTTCRS